jgi:biopolymer transport protein ExbB/TolQ
MTLLERFHGGGVFMYFILVVGIYSLYLLLDRAYTLFLRYRPVPADFRAQLATFLKNGDLSGARAFVKNGRQSALSSIVDLAIELKAGGAGDDELQSRIDEALTERVHKIDKRTAFLAVVGNVATLIGLLGTISGMITSFSAVSGATQSERAMKLSLGISEAMNCTAFGLLVAIPALLGYALFQNKTDSVINTLRDNIAKVYNDLVYLYEPGTAGAKKPVR